MDESEEEPVCPLCLEELDLTDRHFKPCQCGYQICLWCWHQIMEMAEGEGKCPACRTPYDKNKVTEAAQALPEDLTGLISEKKQKDKQTKAAMSASRQHLSSVRVVQRNLVYVIGLPLNIAEEDILKTNQYFGQYGKIHKISTSRSAAYNAASGPNGPTASAYVNFVREEDAVKCIQAVDGAMLEGKLIRACFGTTKYCNSYLKHVPCTNPDCLYLHDIGSHDDSFTKEEMLASKQDYFHNATHPPNYSGKGLPPPSSEASSSTRPLNIPSSSQQQQREGPSTSGSPTPQAALAASSSWGQKSKVPGPAPTAKLPAVAASTGLKVLRPASSSGSALASTPTAAGASATGKGSFTPHKPSAAVLSGRVINANAQPPPFIAVASRNVPGAESTSAASTGVNAASTGVSMAKTISAAQAAAQAALSGRPVTPNESSGSPNLTGFDPTPKQAAAVLAARTSKKVEGSPGGEKTIKTLVTGPIRQGSFVAVAKAAAGVPVGVATKPPADTSAHIPLASDSFPSLQAVVSQSNSRPSSADTALEKQPSGRADKAGLGLRSEGEGVSSSGALGAWGKSLVRTTSGLGNEPSPLPDKVIEKPYQEEVVEATSVSAAKGDLSADAVLESKVPQSETSPGVSGLKDALTKSSAVRASGLRTGRTALEAERANIDSYHYERSAEIPVSRRASHGDEHQLRNVTSFGSGTGVFVPGSFLGQDSLSRSSSPQPAGTGVFLPGLSRTSSGGGGSPSWGTINRNIGGMHDQGGSPKFNRLLGMNMEGGSPRHFRQGSPFEGGSPKMFRPEGGSPNFGRLGTGYFGEGGSPKYGRAGPFQGESGSPAFGRGLSDLSGFGRPPGHFNTLVESGSPKVSRPFGSAPVSRLARLGVNESFAEASKPEESAPSQTLQVHASKQSTFEQQLRPVRTGGEKEKNGSPGESSVIADILGMEFDPWADGPLPDPSGLAKILLAEEKARAAAKTLNPAAPAARQSRFKFAWESEEKAEEGPQKSRFDFAADSSKTGVKSRFGFALEGESNTASEVRPGTAGSSGAGSENGGRFSPAFGQLSGQQTSDSDGSSRPQSRPGTAEGESSRLGDGFGISRPASASGKPLLPVPPGFGGSASRGRAIPPQSNTSAGQGLLPTPQILPIRPSSTPPLASLPPGPAPPPQDADIGFFDPAIMAVGTGKAFEYKPSMTGAASSSPGEAVSPGLLSILKNLGAPPSVNAPAGGESFGSRLPFADAPVRQHGFGGVNGPSFQLPAGNPNPANDRHRGGFGPAAEATPLAPGGWASGQNDPPLPVRNQRGGLSSMMAAIGSGSQALSFANAVAASNRAYSPDLAGASEARGGNSLAPQSSWAAIAAVRTPPAGRKEEAKSREENVGNQEDSRPGTGGEKSDVESATQKAEEKDIGEGSDGGQDEPEETPGKVLTEEEEKKALRKKEKKLRREREKALAAERKQKEAEEAKARERAAAKKEKGATEKGVSEKGVEKDKSALEEEAVAVSKIPDAKGAPVYNKNKRESAEPKQSVAFNEERKGEASKKGVERQSGIAVEKQTANEKQGVNGLSKKRKDALDLGKEDLLSESGEPILQFAKGSDGGPKSPVREKSKAVGKSRVFDERKAPGSESDALNAAGFLASMVTDKKGKALQSPGKSKKDEAQKGGQESKGNVPLGPFGMPVGANMVFGSGGTDFASVFPQNWQGNGMAEGIKAGLSLSALLQQQLELQLQQSQAEPVGGKRTRGESVAPPSGKDFGLPAAAARAAARVFRMAADFVMDDGSSSSSETFSGNGKNGNMNGAPAYGAAELPEMYQFSTTSSAERALASAAAWEQGLRGQEGNSSNGGAHKPLLSQVDALEREVQNAREVERKLETKLMEVKQWIDQDDAVLENITSSYGASETKAAL